MPPRARAKPVAGLAGFVASDSEPDLDMFDKSELQAAVRTMSTTKKPRGRPPGTASKVTKTAPRTTRRNSADKFAPVPEAIAQPATTSKINGGVTKGGRRAKQAPDETVTFEDIGIPASVPATETKKGSRGRPKKLNGNISILAPESAVKRRGRPPRQPTTPIEEIPETQAEDVMELDAVPEEDEDQDSGAGPTEPLESWSSYDTSDVALRRRLGELTKKYEALEMRHRDLREVGVREAERNFDRLKKQAEERTAAATQLISELKAELAAQTALAKEGEELRKQLEASEVKAENLEGNIESLNNSLSEAEAEIKTLSTKLAAVRSGNANPRVPGSAIQASGPANRTAQAEAAHAAQAISQAKENLYADMTGLIMRGVKQEDIGDTFDCIQTGRNGTLHFKLTVDNDDTSDNIEDVQFTYQPQLDAGRDVELMEMLPDYLTEEIVFPRSQAPKFYLRVSKSLAEDLSRQ
ncbi:chromosome segregation protein Csm1/Pcs1-domain-containing protein [Fusarium redolens]|uniref:Chromosome segregation protein Csm1/Pcs1-domain-containing protein n=1 Tax=Fusarium redolens TaxID=48865 RepID=A0A9P9KIM5_FUSRE|nr:chromosome segregation protein Csm1/Pcs1-domain-containing protein [Fusarium redolens]KAH7253949.1 chromosome segregation protein Csm1/Pcs1-domain-containing protein [Fusarium redolens]